MCFEDVEIGQSTPYKTTFVTLPAATVTVIAQRDPMRTFLLITPPANNWVRVLPNMDPTTTTGYVVGTDGASNQMITLETHGRMVQDEWRAIPLDAAGEVIAIIEGWFGGLKHLVGAQRNG